MPNHFMFRATTIAGGGGILFVIFWIKNASSLTPSEAAAWAQAAIASLAIIATGLLMFWQTRQQQLDSLRMRVKADSAKMLAFFTIAGGATVSLERALMLIKPMNLANSQNIVTSLRGGDITDIRIHITRLQGFPLHDFLEPYAVLLCNRILNKCLECNRCLENAISQLPNLYAHGPWGPDEQFAPLLQLARQYNEERDRLFAFAMECARKVGVELAPQPEGT